jgi:very-short-patch-repair endonuclease
MHARDPEAFDRKLEQQETRVESEFERQVLHRLMQAGYRAIPQFKVGAYRIDLVVEGARKRLAVECDGDRWHPPEKMEEDMARQAILERLGWRFVRIRGSQFFRDPQSAMAPVFSRLEDLEIPAEGIDGSEGNVSASGDDIKARIIRRAAELRDQWETANEDMIVAGEHTTSSNGRGSRKRKADPGAQTPGKTLGADAMPELPPTVGDLSESDRGVDQASSMPQSNGTPRTGQAETYERLSQLPLSGIIKEEVQVSLFGTPAPDDANG